MKLPQGMKPRICPTCGEPRDPRKHFRREIDNQWFETRECVFCIRKSATDFHARRHARNRAFGKER